MQEIEIELKNGLSRQEYTYLKNELFEDGGEKQQINHYFETEDFQLRKASAALRIRYKNDRYVSTLKEPNGEGLLETHDLLDDDSAKAWLNNDVILGPNIRKQLDQLGIQQDQLKYFGKLKTLRLEIEKNNCLLVLDHSIYHNKEDYELEIEANSLVQAQEMLDTILSSYKIERRLVPSKIKRFFQAIGKA